MRRRRSRLLLSVYPRSWRREYGEEFLQLLADLDADQPEGRLRRACNVILNAGTIQIAHRRPSTTVLLLFVAGALALLGVYGPVNATNRDAIVWGWNHNTNPLIIAGPHSTYFATGSSTQEGTSNPIVRIHATNRQGHKVTLDCRAGKCAPISSR
ncbi:MAG TPA: hypothetical protein VMF07_22180 [Solirubrobacteraceae bacterium]|nr:hypothetical protein [Solirubrobacteraceae bacterium]